MRAPPVLLVLLAFLSAMLTASHPLYAQWIQLNRPMADFTTLAISGAGISAAGSGARICSSGDAGESWTRNARPPWSSNPDFLCLKLAFFPSVSYVGGDKGRIYRGKVGTGPSISAIPGVTSDILDFAGIQLPSKDLHFACGWGCGVLVSPDSGTTWVATNSGLPNLNLNCMVSMISPYGVNGQVLFVGTYGDGVYWSTDNGQTWAQRGNSFSNLLLDDIIVVDSTVYAGISGSEVYQSINWGETWEKLGQGSAQTELLSLAVMQWGGESWMFAGTIDGGVWRIPTSGGTWEPVNQGLKNLRANSVVCRDSVVYVGTHEGIYRSLNRGREWAQVGSDAIPPISIIHAAEWDSPPLGTDLFVGTPNLYDPVTTMAYGAVYASSNGGLDWRATSVRIAGTGSLQHSGELAFVSDRGELDQRWGVVWSSSDRGRTWKPSGLIGNAYGFGEIEAVRNSQLERVDLYVVGKPPFGGIAFSPDTTLTWSGASPFAEYTPIISHQDSFLFASNSTSLYRVADRTRAWVDLSAGLPYATVTDLSAGERGLYSAFRYDVTKSSFGGVYSSSDYGNTWNPRGLEGKSVTQVVPHDSGMFAIADARAFFSAGENYGWAEVTGNLGSVPVSMLTTTSNRCYALAADGKSIWSRSISDIIQASVNVPLAPILLSPVAGTTKVPLSPLLVWNRTVATESFRVQVATQSSFTISYLVKDTTCVDTTYLLTGLNNGTTYFWHVCGVNMKGPGPWSVTRQFTTIQTNPQVVTLVSPAAGASIVGDSVKLIWRTGVPAVSRYWIESATDSLFVFKTSDSLVVDTLYTLRVLQKGGRYWWKVKANNETGWGPFSETRSFTVSLTAVETAPEFPKEYSLSQNYPNPFNPSTVIRYGLPQRSMVRLSVFSMLGQEVAVLASGEQPAGYHEIRFDAVALSSGVYFYQLQAGEFLSRKKFLLLR